MASSRQRQPETRDIRERLLQRQCFPTVHLFQTPPPLSSRRHALSSSRLLPSLQVQLAAAVCSCTAGIQTTQQRQRIRLCRLHRGSVRYVIVAPPKRHHAHLFRKPHTTSQITSWIVLLVSSPTFHAAGCAASGRYFAMTHLTLVRLKRNARGLSAPVKALLSNFELQLPTTPALQRRR